MDPDGHLPTVRGKTFQKTALPSINSARYSPGGRDVQSPMVSYLQLRSSRYKGRAKPFRQLSRHYSVDGKEPLTSIAAKLPETGCTGGFFNSSAVLKSLPLEGHSHLVGTNFYKGTRTVMVHGDRFLPHIRSMSDSLIGSGRDKPWMQRERLSASEQRSERNHFLKDLLQDPPHRLEYGYYMKGHMCPLQNKDGTADQDYGRPVAPNTELYFGKGIRMHHPPSISHNTTKTESNSENTETNKQTKTSQMHDNVFITQK